MDSGNTIHADDFFGQWDSGGGSTLLPDPPPSARSYTVISVDDHVVEPPDMFEGRLPQRFLERGPRVVTNADGRQVWLYDGTELPNIGLNAVAGRPIEEVTSEPTRFDQMRRGAWDVHSRIKDMNIDGVWASINFPSFLSGFGGARLQLSARDTALAFEVVRAYNDWHLEAWVGAYPERLIPIQLPWLLDPEIGAKKIYANAARGFRGLTFPEAPDKLGLPSWHTRHWDPMMRACAETGTVLCLHAGSGGQFPMTSRDAPLDVTTALMSVFASFAAVDVLFACIPLRFPEIKICLTEGGIGWIVGLLDRLDHSDRYIPVFETFLGADVTPSECLKRNFWFCALDDPSSFALRRRIGVDHIMLEVDYPHADTSWPGTQELLRRSLAGIPADEVAKITWRNASELFRHTVPRDIQKDPCSY